jgi:hypothetical protein
MPARRASKRKSAPRAAAASIRRSCERHWEAFKDDCSGFLKAVGADFLDAVPPGQADTIIELLRRAGAGWTHVGNTPDAAAMAARHADEGRIVFGGLQSDELNPPRNNGHVVVVVSGPLVHGRYPRAYWGVLNGTGRKDEGVNWAFNANDRDRVDYFSRAVDKVPASFRRAKIRAPRKRRSVPR